MKKVIAFLPYITLFLSFLMISAPALAQGPGDGGPKPTDPPVTEIPIDGGASLLLAGGVAFGLKKLRDRRKTAKNQ
jgi:hypothetical protein